MNDYSYHSEVYFICLEVLCTMATALLSQNQGYLLGGPHNADYSIFVPYLGKTTI